MQVTLDQIIQTGGPAGMALLFAWLWLDARQSLKDLNKRLDDERKEHREFLNRILRKAGYDV